MGSRNSNSVNQKKRRGRKRKKALIIFAVIAAVAGMLFGVTYKVFEADTIEFVGSTHYSDEELKKYIFGGDYVNLLYFRIFGQKDTKIPFIQKYDVETDWPDRLYVTVYEKAIVGYVRYMGCNMYFDKDGIVVESSTDLYENVPQIDGLKFDSIVINTKLDVEMQIYTIQFLILYRALISMILMWTKCILMPLIILRFIWAMLR